MAKSNVVSIWLGNFETEEKFQEFIAEKYDENGDISSSFMASFNIIDIDFQESLFQKTITIDDLLQASYSESFINKLEKENIKLSNCVIHNYSGKIKSSNHLNFIGTFKYKKSLISI